MLASVRSATLVGVDGQRRHRRGPRRRPACPPIRSSVCPTPRSASRASACAPRCCRRQLEWPPQRITVNLAPGGRAQDRVRARARGRARARSAAESHLPAGVLDGVGVLGELGLDGSVRPVPGMLVLVDALRAGGVERSSCPPPNAARGGARRRASGVRAARVLGELRECLKGEAPWPDGSAGATDDATTPDPLDDEPLDLADVRGLRARAACARGRGRGLAPPAARRAARRGQDDAGPPAAHDPARRSTATRRSRSRASTPSPGAAPCRGLARERPFRAPHHTASTAALVGGGAARPRRARSRSPTAACCSSTSSASSPRRALDALRQPLEERVVRIARQAMSLDVPGRLPCSSPAPTRARAVSAARAAACSELQRARYRRRLSAPLLDRFDLRLRGPAARTGRRPGRAVGRRRASRVAEAVDRQQRALRPTGRGGATPTSRRARSPPSSRSPPKPTDAWRWRRRRRAA